MPELAPVDERVAVGQGVGVALGGGGEACAGVFDLLGECCGVVAEVEVDRASFEMNWNQMGMLKGLATVSVVARFTRSAAESGL